MELQAILDKISEDARLSAQETLTEAHKKADALRESARLRMEKSAGETERRIEKDAAEQKERMERMAELEEKKRFLAGKRVLLSRAFDQAHQKLAALPEQELRAFFLERVAGSAEGDEVLCPCLLGPSFLDAGFVDEANALLQKQGKKGTLSLGGDKAPGFGFVLKKGGAEINCTLEAMVDAVRLESETDAAGILFS